MFEKFYIDVVEARWLFHRFIRVKLVTCDVTPFALMPFAPMLVVPAKININGTKA